VIDRPEARRPSQVRAAARPRRIVWDSQVTPTSDRSVAGATDAGERALDQVGPHILCVRNSVIDALERGNQPGAHIRCVRWEKRSASRFTPAPRGAAASRRQHLPSPAPPLHRAHGPPPPVLRCQDKSPPAGRPPGQGDASAVLLMNQASCRRSLPLNRYNIGREGLGHQAQPQPMRSGASVWPPQRVSLLAEATLPERGCPQVEGSGPPDGLQVRDQGRKWTGATQ